MSRGLLVPASYVLLLRGDRADVPRGDRARVEVLLHLRQHTGFRDGHWASLAGHVEVGETAAAAAVREAREEAGVEIAPRDLEPLTTVHRIIPGAGQVEQRVDFFWTARSWTGEPRITEPAKTADLRWFALDALPEPVVPHERTVLDALRTGAVPAILLA